ncbi:MAG: putative Rossmann fold flavoprotein [Sulfurimonas sp.]|jgi:predicted Rossmann fold flavoprotein|uniref:NAD(P)/FAD-dependent oxidoreductase n=1 Tax=Sulfurimonas sp. TaxID=2022749 RepID=UPI0039E28124
MKKIAIIGAGASGILCSILCSKESTHVDIYEQNSKCAKKILVSGNGRCNITNTSFSQNDYFSQNPHFVKEALENFSFTQFSKLCSSIGLELEVKNDGKVYPLSNEAKSVASLLENHARNLGVHFHTDTQVTNLQDLSQKYDAVVVATGSEAASHLGGNRDGLEFASSIAHTIIPTYPSLVQLELSGTLYEKMSGAKVDGEVTLIVNSKAASTTNGDILFTNYGVSGFAILDISQLASESLMNFQAVDISINLLPKYTAQKLSAYIMKMSQLNTHLSILNMLHGLIPLKISKTILDVLEFSHTALLSEITTKQSKKIANQILNWKFEIKDTHGFRHAEVSGGGVDTQEVNPKTMESFKQKNLYFIGEVLDVLGRRGGFNFAWSWASANACAKDITKKL